MFETGDDKSTTVFEVTNEDNGPEFIETKGGEVVEDETPAKAVKEEAEPKSAKADVQTEVVAETYNPDFTYSVRGQKKEFPEWVRAAIKAKDAEDHLRDLYTKADGLEPVKEREAQVSKEYAALQGKHGELTGTLNELQYYLDKRHLSHLFEKIGLPTQEVINYVAGILKEQDLDPQIRAQVQGARQRDVELFLEQKNSTTLQQQNLQLQRNAFALSLENAMRMPEVEKVRSYVDSAVGDGAFKAAVDAHGLAHFAQHQRDMNPAEAVAAVMKHYKGFIGEDIETVTQDLAVAQAAQRAAKPKGHIPNVGKRTNGSPVKALPRSVADLRKIAEAKVG